MARRSLPTAFAATRVAAVCAALWLAACVSLPEGIPARGVFADTAIDTRVDAPIARYYLEHYNTGRRGDAAWDALFDAMHRQLDTRLPTRAELIAWSRQHSIDLAALLLARQFALQPDRRGLRRAYAAERAALRAAAREGTLDRWRVSADALFVFVPGWLYRADPNSGADFKTQRAVLARHGARVHFAAVAENGSVEENAAALAALLRELAVVEHRIILVSTSKGGPEVALALSQLATTPAVQAVKAWVNIGGLLRGTALADQALRWPARWYVRAYVLPDGDFAGVRSMARARSAERLRQMRWPAHVLIADYLALPLSGQLSARARDGYALLRGEGPNDGLTPILDALTPDGVALLNFGVDHFFQHDEIELHTLALARALLRVLGSAAPK